MTRPARRPARPALLTTALAATALLASACGGAQDEAAAVDAELIYTCYAPITARVIAAANKVFWWQVVGTGIAEHQGTKEGQRGDDVDQQGGDGARIECQPAGAQPAQSDERQQHP